MSVWRWSARTEKLATAAVAAPLREAAVRGRGSRVIDRQRK